MSESSLAREFVARFLAEGDPSRAELLLLTFSGSSQCSWDRVLAYAAREKVLPTVGQKLCQLRLCDRLPPDLADFFRGLQELSLSRNRLFIAESAKIARLLNRVGVEPVALKGAAYVLTGVHPEPSSRFMRDLDFLITDSKTDEAIDVLQSNGYSIANQNPYRVSHHSPPIRSANGIIVELHQSLGLGRCPEILPARQVIESSTPMEIEGARVRVPRREHLITHHIMHSQIHDSYSERIWPSLRAMYDLVLLGHYCKEDSTAIWAAVMERFRENGSLDLLAAHLSLVEKTFEVKFPCIFPDSRALQLRNFHRTILRRFPFIRHIDPIYFASAAVVPRLRIVNNIARIPGGWKYLAKTPFRSSFYRHLLDDVMVKR